MKSRRFVIAGYYGFGNAGDELILRSILNHLTRSNLGKKDCVVVLSNNPKRTEIEHGVNSVNRWSPLGVLKALFWCDLLIFGGGGLLQDRTGSFGLWYYLSILWLAICFRKKIVVSAIGVGPIQLRLNKFLVAHTLNYVDELTIRDHGSLLELQKLPVRKSAEVVLDPVLSLSLPVKDSAVSSIVSPRIGVVMRPLIRSKESSFFNGRGEAVFTELLARSVCEFAKKIHAKISIIPFHADMDGIVTKRLSQELNGEGEIFQWKNLDELLSFFSQMDFVISMRLHGILLSTLMKIPVVGVAVDPKIDYFFEEFSSHLSASHLVSLEQVKDQKLFFILLKSWESRQNFYHLVEENLPKLKGRLRSSPFARFFN